MVNKGIKIIAGFDTYATAYYSACLITPWTEWPEGLYRRPHHHIAGFDTYATAYYSACLISPWTEWPALAECIEGHFTITAGFDMLRTQPAWFSRGLSGPLWRSVSKDTSSHRRLRYTALLSLLDFPVDWVVRRVVSKATIPQSQASICFALSLLVCARQ